MIVLSLNKKKRIQEPNLDLYTKLAGLFFFSLGLNFFLVFVYWKFISPCEYARLVLILSVLMLMLTPIVMKDSKKENRNLVAIVSYGIVHDAYTIISILVTRFWLLSVVYVFELLVVILLLIKNKRRHK